MPRQQAEAAERIGRQARDDGSHLLDEVAALLTLTSAIFALVSFVGYHLAPDGPTLAGRVGYGLADVVVQGFGLAAYLLPLFLLAIAASMFRQAKEGITSARLVGAPVILFCAAVLLALFSPAASERPVSFAGGWVGGILAELMSQAFGVVGSAILCGALLVLSFVVVARVSLVGALSAGFGAVGRTAARLPAAVLPRR